MSLNPMGAGWVPASACTGTEGLQCDGDASVQCLDGDQTLTGRSWWAGTANTPILMFDANGQHYEVSGDAALTHEIGMLGGATILQLYGTAKPAGALGPAFEAHGYRILDFGGGDVATVGIAELQGSDVVLDVSATDHRKLEPGALTTKVRNQYVGWKIVVVGKPDGDQFKIWRLAALRKVR